MTADLDLYPWFAVASSLVITVLFGAHAARAAWARIHYHDDRSAFDLLVALTLLVASFGLLISALASFVSVIGLDMIARSEMRNAGLAMVRGVLLVTAIVMVMADARLPARR